MTADDVLHVVDGDVTIVVPPARQPALFFVCDGKVWRLDLDDVEILDERERVLARALLDLAAEAVGE
jgi:hypothetical protein